MEFFVIFIISALVGFFSHIFIKSLKSKIQNNDDENPPVRVTF